MGILSALLEMMTERQPAVRLVPARCLKSRLNTCDCRRCLDVCAPGALSLVGRRIVLDPEKCTACMSCTAVCPNDALMGEPDLPSLLAAIASRPPTAVCCSRGRLKPGDEVTVPCVGIFSAEALLALGRSGSDGIRFDLGRCANCINHHAAVRFRARLEHLRAWAPDLPTPLMIDGGCNPTTDMATPDRRAYLSHCLAGLSQASPVGHPQRPAADRTGGGRIGDKRIPTHVRILERVIASAEEGEREQLTGHCCYRLTVDDRCTLCRRCTAICPTGAIRLQRSEQKSHVVFTAARCSGCGLCISFCREKALALQLPRWATNKLAASQVMADQECHE